ncbi:hypothetical protein L210DRAFT_3528668 [Boletus edulis BED1]|uniref:Uncharacterized protein n=1 Tax=Boletus edulis BED1 TaxID=1328754 RepID=A0AAD4GIG9_BOLED|nr:hypothetical protein L210DRAFT_3528668 [Boletus edulis BED1]
MTQRIHGWRDGFWEDIITYSHDGGLNSDLPVRRSARLISMVPRRPRGRWSRGIRSAFACLRAGSHKFRSVGRM